MTPENLRQDYQAFFMKHEAGKYFIDHVNSIITGNHEDAENNPDLSRDHVQRAKGAREVIDHIASVMGGTKASS